jgi:hypothetical protein
MPFTSPNGGDPIAYTKLLAAASMPTQGDCLALSGFEAQSILSRTSNGLDSRGQAFTDYNSTRPYYHTTAPGPARTRRQLKTAKSTGGYAIKNSYSIRYPSYKDFKLAIGHTNVDLNLSGGMLASLQCHALGSSMTPDEAAIVPASSHPSPCQDFSYGIPTGPEEVKARAHNEGLGYMPRRHFLDTPPEDLIAMQEILVRRAYERLKGIK